MINKTIFLLSLLTSGVLLNAQPCEIIYTDDSFQGLPRDIEQRKNGNLVFAIGKALYEYDFQILKKRTYTSSVKGIELDQNNGMWVYTGGHLLYYGGDNVELYGSHNSSLKGGIRDICIDHLDRLWVVTSENIFIKEGDQFIPLDLGVDVYCIIEHNESILLGGNQRVHRYEGDKIHDTYTFPGGIALDIIVDYNNAIWVHSMKSSGIGGSTVESHYYLIKIIDGGFPVQYLLESTINDGGHVFSDFDICQNNTITLVEYGDGKDVFLIDANSKITANPQIHNLSGFNEIYHIDGEDNLFVVGGNYIAKCLLEQCLVTSTDESKLIYSDQTLIAPNPFSNSFTILDNGFNESFKIEVFNTNGHLVLAANMSAGEKTVTIDHQLPAGIYILKILTEGKIESSRRIIKL